MPSDKVKKLFADLQEDISKMFNIIMPLQFNLWYQNQNEQQLNIYIPNIQFTTNQLILLEEYLRNKLNTLNPLYMTTIDFHSKVNCRNHIRLYIKFQWNDKND